MRFVRQFNEMSRKVNAYEELLRRFASQVDNHGRQAIEDAMNLVSVPLNLSILGLTS